MRSTNATIRNSKSSPPLSAHSLVTAETTFPHEVCPGPGEHEPAGLDRERLRESRALYPPKKNGDRGKQLIIKRQPLHHGVDCRGHDVDRKHLAAKKVFERIDDENDCRDLQDPKRHHRQAVSDKKLN